VQEENKGPHTEVGNTGQHREARGSDLSPGLARVAARARSQPKEAFNSLMHHLTTGLIREHLNKMPSRTGTGEDEMTVDQARKNLDWLLPPIMEQVHQGKYEAPPVRRVYIPKVDGSQRPIGIPTVIDRAIQGSVAKILEQIYERDFQKVSFGFRPGIGCHQALATVGELVQNRKLYYALEVDIRDFFGSLNHEWLRKFVGLRCGDKRMLKLIDSWLGAGAMESGQWQVSEQGTPQGGSISPLLANIYLHYVLDLWWEKKIKRRLKGASHLVRYADDFVILFAEKSEAEEALKLIRFRLEQFGLGVAEEKTRITDLTPRVNGGGERRRITFLGMNIFLSLNRKKTGWKVVYQTEGKRFGRAKTRLKERMRNFMHRNLEEQAKAINQFLVGHFNYYGLPGNSRKLVALRTAAVLLWRRCLSRRSQRGATDWEKMTEILNQYPLRQPRLKITYGGLHSYAML